jgi:hypothetical protein
MDADQGPYGQRSVGFEIHAGPAEVAGHCTMLFGAVEEEKSNLRILHISFGFAMLQRLHESYLARVDVYRIEAAHGYIY